MSFYDKNGLLKQGKQKLVFYYGIEGDSKPLQELNSTPGDLYYSEFSDHDHGFKMEKKLESYKMVMMRAQNSIMIGDYDPSNPNGVSRNDFTNDNGMVRQLGLGCGLSLSQLSGTGAADGVRLDWLDRMVLTQIQHTVGALSPGTARTPQLVQAYLMGKRALALIMYRTVERAEILLVVLVATGRMMIMEVKIAKYGSMNYFMKFMTFLPIPLAKVQVRNRGMTLTRAHMSI